MVASSALAQTESEVAVDTSIEQSTKGRVVVFASEKLDGDWIGSFFNTLDDGQPVYNQCEISLGETLEAMGFEVPVAKLTQDERKRVKKLKTVFQRYHDMSTMANTTAVQASRIVDPSAGIAVLCSVEVGAKKKRWSRKSAFRSCAEVLCKAISTADAKRMVTHKLEECAGSGGETEASVQAIRDVCSEAGRGLGKKLMAAEGRRP